MKITTEQVLKDKRIRLEQLEEYYNVYQNDLSKYEDKCISTLFQIQKTKVEIVQLEMLLSIELEGL